jgi:hypothetical protein
METQTKDLLMKKFISFASFTMKVIMVVIAYIILDVCKNSKFSSKELGEIIIASTLPLLLIGLAFSEIKKIKTPKKHPNKQNSLTN